MNNKSACTPQRSGKERMLRVLGGQPEMAVGTHWWGLYKFEFAGLISGYADEHRAWSLGGADLFGVDARFWEEFRPDFFHLTTGPRHDVNPQMELELKAFRQREDVLESKAAIDAFLSLLSRTTEQVASGGEFDHVALCAKAYGDQALIALNEGSDTAWLFDSWLGFEKTLIGMLEEPENLQYFLSGLYDRTLMRMQALKNAGAHAFINSETYCSSDILSPAMYRDVIWPVQKRFYDKLQNIGLIPIVYFTGDILPILEDIKRLPVNGLMMEAPKKGFSLDVGEVAQRLEGTMALFGNLDSHGCLELGTREQVVAETGRQIALAKRHPFIVCNDCPISFQTPTQNVHAMIQTAKEHLK